MTLCLLAAQAGFGAEVDGGDPLGRDTPRGTVEGFLRAIDANEPERAAQYLDLRNLPARITQYSPEQLAAGLAVVLQRSTWIDLEELSDDPDGEAGDGLPSYRDLLVELDTRERPVRVMLQRVPGDDDSRIWKFSNASIAELDLLYEVYRYNPVVEWFWTRLPDVSLLGLELFKWVSSLAAMVAAAPLVLLVAWLLARLIIRPDRPLHPNLRRFLMGPVTAFVLILIGSQVIASLGTGLGARRALQSYTIVTAATVWLLWQTGNLVRDVYLEQLRDEGREGSAALLRPLTTAWKLLVLLLGTLVWLDNLGFEITAVLTGLGIGGVAVALVLQKPLEDVFGAITLYTQQPIRIGDFGRFGQHTGTVEEISLRTTRIRTLDNTVVSVPNMRLASEPIENLSSREKYLYRSRLKLRSSISREEVENVLGGFRELLEGHERVYEGSRARLVEVSALGFDIELFAYVDARDWPDYLEVAEALNLGVLEIIERAGVELAAPMAELIGGASR
jgi:MscS family membrane protein